MSLRMIWAYRAVIIKPWTSRTKVERRNDGTLLTETIPGIAEEINVAANKMEKLLRYLAIHASEGVVMQDPPQPSTNANIVTSKEVDTYIRAVMVSDTVAGAAAIWRPSSSTSDQLKRLQPRARPDRGRGGYNGAW